MLSLCCVADEIQTFMEEVKSLGYQDKPPYEKLRSILQAGLKAVQAKDDGKLKFAAVTGAASPPAKVSTHTLKPTTTLVILCFFPASLYCSTEMNGHTYWVCIYVLIGNWHMSCLSTVVKSELLLNSDASLLFFNEK